MSTVLELIEEAKSIHFEFPEKPICEWESHELLYGTIFMGIKNEIQTRACLFILDKFAPLKIFVKGLLKDYIKQNG